MLRRPDGVWSAHTILLWRARLRGRALVADHGDALDLDQHAGAGKVRHGDQRAAGIIAVLERIAPNLDETVAVARVVDEHRHGDEVGEAAARLVQGLVHQRKDRAHLWLE